MNDEKKRCWLWHRFGDWQPAYHVDLPHAAGRVRVFYKRKVCRRCGKEVKKHERTEKL